MCCWMGVFFIRWVAVLPISWVSINLYSGLDSRVPDEARRARGGQLYNSADSFSLAGWQTPLGCCIKLFQLTLIAFSLLYHFECAPECRYSARRKKCNEIDTTNFEKQKKSKNYILLWAEAEFLMGRNPAFVFFKENMTAAFFYDTNCIKHIHWYMRLDYNFFLKHLLFLVFFAAP